MRKTAFISDLIFTFFLASLASLCLFRFLNITFGLSLILATICGSLTTCSIAALLQSKQNKIFLKRSDEETMQKLFLHLALLNDEEKLSFIRTALETKSNSEQNKNRESFENCENWKELLSPTRLESENTLCFLRFHFSPIHADDILPIAYFPSKKKKILFCLKIEEEAFRLCKQLGITPKTGEDIFFFIKKRNAFPSQFLGDTLPNEKKRRQKLWFSKNNSRRFLTSGALVLFASLWTPFPHYYLVFSIALFLTSLFVRIWGYE